MLYKIFAVFVLAVTCVIAETHIVSFENRCGSGTPTLIFNGEVVSTGGDYTSNGPLSGIAYLQTGNCGFNGDNCLFVEMNLNNPSCPGCGSYTDLSLIPPHAFSVTTGFTYYNGCEGAGARCDNANCNTAFHTSTDYQVLVACQEDNVNLHITFCV